MDRTPGAYHTKHFCEFDENGFCRPKGFFDKKKIGSVALFLAVAVLLGCALYLLSGELPVARAESNNETQVNPDFSNYIKSGSASSEEVVADILNEKLALSAVLIQERSYCEAINVLNDMLAQESSDQMRAVVYYNRGLCYYYLDDISMAIEDFHASVDSSPFADAYYSLGRAYAESGMSGCEEAAIQAYSEAIALEPEDLECLLVRASAYELIGQAENALQDYRAALELDEENEYARGGVERLVSK